METKTKTDQDMTQDTGDARQRLDIRKGGETKYVNIAQQCLWGPKGVGAAKGVCCAEQVSNTSRQRSDGR
jgi:hypothetical protein